MWQLRFIDDVADVELVTRVKRLRQNNAQGSNSDISGPGLFVRSPANSPSYGYKFSLGSIPNYYRHANILYRLSSGSTGVLTSGNVLPALTEQWDALGAAVWMRFRVSGNALMGRCWWDGDQEPETWQLTATNDYLSSGAAGLLLMGSNELAQVDFLGIGTDGDAAPTAAPAPYIISGHITDGDGVPAARRVLVIDRTLGEIVHDTMSNAETGQYVAPIATAGEYTRVVLADDAAEGVVYNDIVDRIIVP